MADLISPKALANKFFINSLAAGRGMQALMRGQILGPIGVEFAPYYLCRVFPAEDDAIDISTETVQALEQLVGVYFYDDRATLDAAWIQLKRTIETKMIAARKQKAKQRKREIAAMIEQLKARGITTVPQEQVESYVARSQQLDGVMEQLVGEEE